MKLNYLPITKSKRRMDRFIIELDNSNYIFEVYWNDVGKFFAFNMYDIDKNPIILGRKITYNVNMLDNIIDKRVPQVEIIPYNTAAQNTKITFNNFVEDIKCYIFPVGGS